MSGVPKTNALSFGSAAAQYERGRPGYPTAALDWLLAGDAARVLDLGAGTGKLTRLLAERGLDVVAVEPLEEMRDQLSRVSPQIRTLAGSAEQIPLPDNDFDIVMAAQAWHWVDPVKAVPEVARVLRPGGRLGLVWNFRDDSVDWVADLSAILDSTDAASMDTDSPTIGPPFGAAEQFSCEWTHLLDRQAFSAMIESRSYFIVMSAADQRAMLDRVHRLLDTHRDLVGKEMIAMPYITNCVRAQLI